MLLQATPPPLPTIPFDPNQLIPLFGMLGGMLIAGVFLWRFFTSEMAAAIAERIRTGVRRRKAAIDDVQGEHITELDQRITDMQGQIAEMAERLDFAERLLAQKRERSLPGA
ncbi:MAG: hypothetical protein DMD48_00805 [Gemmatimonadetes bacterium]|nr:MAG: hypothetical protein DMD48_00805 [Gemmatimonadota bacterium]